MKSDSSVIADDTMKDSKAQCTRRLEVQHPPSAKARGLHSSSGCGRTVQRLGCTALTLTIFAQLMSPPRRRSRKWYSGTTGRP